MSGATGSVPEPASGPRDLLSKLRRHATCRLRPSLLDGGVGVFAEVDIAASTRLFADVPDESVLFLTHDQLDSLPSPIGQLVRDLTVRLVAGHFVPARGVNGLGLSWYVNHSFEPNLDWDGDFITLRHIHAGEELTVDYRQLSYGAEGTGDLVLGFVSGNQPTSQHTHTKG